MSNNRPEDIFNYFLYKLGHISRSSKLSTSLKTFYEAIRRLEMFELNLKRLN